MEVQHSLLWKAEKQSERALLNIDLYGSTMTR